MCKAGRTLINTIKESFGSNKVSNKLESMEIENINRISWKMTVLSAYHFVAANAVSKTDVRIEC